MDQPASPYHFPSDAPPPPPSVPPSPPPSPAAPRRRGARLVAVGTAAAIVVAAAVGGFAVGRTQDGSAASGASTQDYGSGAAGGRGTTPFHGSPFTGPGASG